MLPDAVTATLKVDFNPDVFGMRVSAELIHEGIPVLTAGATNAGWGALIARGAAAENLAESAAKNFDE
jgi:hypothetical protein